MIMFVIDADPRLNQMALCRALGADRASLVHLLDSLETSDLVKCVRSLTDRNMDRFLRGTSRLREPGAATCISRNLDVV